MGWCKPGAVHTLCDNIWLRLIHANITDTSAELQWLNRLAQHALPVFDFNIAVARCTGKSMCNGVGLQSDQNFV